MPDRDHILKWEETRWRQDTEILSPLARGVYRDLIGYLHVNSKRCGGVLTGSRDELARAGRCSLAELNVTLSELQKHHVANVSENTPAPGVPNPANGVTNSVTIVVRRMKREADRRENSLNRVEKWRKTKETPPCKTPRYKQRYQSVTPPKPPKPPLTQLFDSIDQKPRQSSQSYNSTIKEGLTKLTISIPSLDRIAGEIISNKHDWHWDNCKIKPADFAFRKSLTKKLREFVGQITEPQVHSAWAEAVKRTHQALVDEKQITNPAGYCIQCWMESLESYTAPTPNDAGER